jgi:hypothetical protein
VGPQTVIEAVSSSGSFLDGAAAQAAPALGGAAVRPDVVEAGDLRHPRGIPAQAAIMIAGLREAGALRRGAGRHLHCWGDIRVAAGDQRRNVVLPRGAGAAGDHGAGSSST